MTITEKFIEILTYQNKTPEQIKQVFNSPITDSQITEIEKLLEENIPDGIKELYRLGNGFLENDNYETEVTFFGAEMRDSDGILLDLAFSKSCVKTETPVVPNPEFANTVFEKIIDIVKKQTKKANKNNWQKISFECSHESIADIELFNNSDNKVVDSIELSDDNFDVIIELCEQLHEKEYEHYNWHELKFTIYENTFEVTREFHDYADMFDMTSVPEDAIKPLYFHYKWLPIFGDGGGNFIGVDLDPDRLGVKGQIISFGRDYEEMTVLANSMDELFNKILVYLPINAKNNIDYQEIHMIDFLLENII